MAGMIHGVLHIIMYRITGICDYSIHTRKSYRLLTFLVLLFANWTRLVGQLFDVLKNFPTSYESIRF